MFGIKQEKIYSSLFQIAFVLNGFFPICALISTLFGYEFSLFNYPVMAIITMAVTLVFMVFAKRKRDYVIEHYKKIYFPILPVLAFLNFIFYFKGYNSESSYVTIIFSAVMILDFVFAVILNFIISDTKARQITNIIAVIVLVIPLIIGLLFVTLFGSIGYVKVVRSVPSPNGEYIAEILDSNQGALGGDTIIQIQEDKGINCLIFKIEKKPNRIYYGEWGEFDDIDVRWENNEVVLIDAVKYPIK